MAFNFERRGQIEVVGVVEEDTIIEAALEADVDDVEVKVRHTSRRRQGGREGGGQEA